MDPIVHFEIPVNDMSRAKEFYTKTFGWQTNDMPEMNYVMVHTTQVNEQQMPMTPGAINGGMMKKDEGTPYPILVIKVENLDNSLIKIQEAGCKIVLPKMQVGNMGWYARFVDTENNIIGVWQDVEK